MWNSLFFFFLHFSLFLFLSFSHLFVRALRVHSSLFGFYSVLGFLCFLAFARSSARSLVDAKCISSWSKAGWPWPWAKGKKIKDEPLIWSRSGYSFLKGTLMMQTSKQASKRRDKNMWLEKEKSDSFLPSSSPSFSASGWYCATQTDG